MKLIGLTGGIASGKSTVGRLLRERGVDVVDADVLARDAVAPGTPALAAIVMRWGTDVLAPDGTLDRKRLGALVFGPGKDEERRALNQIVHPAVAALAVERLGQLRDADKRVAVYEVPLLFENNLEGMMDATLLVALSEPVQLARVMARDALSEADARARIAAQMPLADKRKRATFVIENDGTLDDLGRALDAVWPSVLAR